MVIVFFGDCRLVLVHQAVTGVLDARFDRISMPNPSVGA